MAALEKSSAETEKLIDEAKTEKLRHMEELYQSNRRVAELEAKYVPIFCCCRLCGCWFGVDDDVDGGDENDAAAADDDENDDCNFIRC